MSIFKTESDAVRQAAEHLMTLDHHLHVAQKAIEMEIPHPGGAGANYLKTRKHFALVRSADAVKTALAPEFEKAKRMLLAAIDADERRTAN